MEELKEQRGLRKGARSQGHTIPLMTQPPGCGKHAVRGLRLEGTAEADPGLADPEPCGLFSPRPSMCGASRDR